MVINSSNDLGNRTSKIHDDLLSDALDRAFSYSYDPNDRLTQERIMNGTSLTEIIASTTLYEYGTLSAAGALTPGTTLARVTKYEWTDTTSTGTKLSQTEYRYDVAGRTAEVKVDSFGTSPTSITTQFTYDQAGSRLSQRVTEGGATKTTLYTVDANNPTGYAQVIEERTTTSGASGTQVRTSYTIGLDVIAQQSAQRSETSPGTWSDWQQQELRTLLYDGHGSTRAVMLGTGHGAPNSTPPILPAQIAPGQLFTYDAYGQMLSRFNGTSEVTVTPLTTLLYSGEQTDASTGLQYLRARYYSPSVGRFTTMDPFAGLQSDPQSLHKYLYAHANPIMNADPSGEFPLAFAPIIGASVGLTAALDAHLGGEDHLIVSSFFAGLILGTVLAPVLSAVPGLSLAAGIGLGAWGVVTAKTPEQAIFRGLMTIGGVAIAARMIAANLQQIAGAANGFNSLATPARGIGQAASNAASEMPGIYRTASEFALALLNHKSQVTRTVNGLRFVGKTGRLGDTYIVNIAEIEYLESGNRGMSTGIGGFLNTLIEEAVQSGAREIRIFGYLPNTNTQRVLDSGFLSRRGFNTRVVGELGTTVEIYRQVR